MNRVSAYRVLLGAYPRAYRDARGEEMLAVLLATEERRGRWSVVPEAGSLVAHGLALRVRRPLSGRTPGPSRGLAGVGLLLMLAVLGAHQLAATGLRGLGLDGLPESSQVWQLWLDPRWPIQLAWLATGVALLLRRHRTALALAWTAALLHAWLGLAEVAPGFAPPWFGDVGPAWDAPFGPGQVGWLLLTWLAATLIGGPTRLTRAFEAVPARSWTSVLLTGILASAVASLAAPALWLTAPGGRVSDSVRGAVVLALVASGAPLVLALRRTPHGRRAILLLLMAAELPLATRWTAPGPLPVTVSVAAALTAGCTLVLHRRAGAGRSRRPTDGAVAGHVRPPR